MPIRLGVTAMRYAAILATLAIACGQEQTPVATHAADRVNFLPPPTLENSGIQAIGSSAIDDLDRLYMSGRGNGRVHVWGPGGQQSHGPSTEGSGPGELASIVDMAVLDGMLWLRDAGRPSYERFDTAGGYRRSVRFPTTTLDGERVQVIGVRRDDRFWSLRERSTSGDGPYLELLVIDSIGRALPPLARVAPGLMQSFDRSRTPAAASAYYAVENGLAVVVVAADSTGQEPVESRNVVIKLFGDDGVPLRTIAHDAPWLPLTDVERDANLTPIGGPGDEYAELAVPTGADASGTEAVVLQSPATPALPARRGISSPVPGLILGRDSTVWLRTRTIGTDSVEWIGWRPGASREIRIHLDAAISLLAANREWLWGARRVASGRVTAVRMALLPINTTPDSY